MTIREIATAFGYTVDSKPVKAIARKALRLHKKGFHIFRDPLPQKERRDKPHA